MIASQERELEDKNKFITSLQSMTDDQKERIKSQEIELQKAADIREKMQKKCE
jgi:hypothetical protein